MVVINFSHPITSEQQQQIEQLTGQPVLRVVEIPVQFDHARPFHEQAVEIIQRVGLEPDEWQTQPIVINLPGFSSAAGVLLAELHGRMGYFPPILRLRPVQGANPPRFEVCEIINLQDVRSQAREKRL